MVEGKGSRAPLAAAGQAQQLLTLADHLQGILVPVEPPARFRQRLRGDLVAGAQRRRPRRTNLVLIGVAAAGWLVSLVGVVVALLMRSRQGLAPEHTSRT